MKNLKDKVVFITGGARGLGYAMAEKFAAEGAKIVIGDIQEALAMESAEKIQKEFGVETYAFQMDVTSVENIKAAFGKGERALRKTGCTGQLRGNSDSLPV